MPNSIPASAAYWAAMADSADLLPRDRELTNDKNGVNSRAPTARVIKVAGRDLPCSDLSLKWDGRLGVSNTDRKAWKMFFPVLNILQFPALCVFIRLSCPEGQIEVGGFGFSPAGGGDGNP